jgi:hypothetical protein
MCESFACGPLLEVVWLHLEQVDIPRWDRWQSEEAANCLPNCSPEIAPGPSTFTAYLLEGSLSVLASAGNVARPAWMLTLVLSSSNCQLEAL